MSAFVLPAEYLITPDLRAALDPYIYLFDALHPVLNVFEGLLVCDVVHQDDALPTAETEVSRTRQRQEAQRERTEADPHHGSSVVGCSDGLEPLLPRCVPARAQTHTHTHTSMRQG